MALRRDYPSIAGGGDEVVAYRDLARAVAAHTAGDLAEAARLGGEPYVALVKKYIAKYGPEVFAAELPGILAWAVEGCVFWQEMRS